MIDLVAGWVRSLVATLLALTFLEMLVPEGNLRKFVRVILGLVVVSAVLSPLGRLWQEGLPELSWTGPPEASDWAARAAAVQEAGMRVAAETARPRLEEQVAGLLALVPGVARAEVAATLDEHGAVVRVTARVFPTGAPSSSHRTLAAGGWDAAGVDGSARDGSAPSEGRVRCDPACAGSIEPVAPVRVDLGVGSRGGGAGAGSVGSPGTGAAEPRGITPLEERGGAAPAATRAGDADPALRQRVERLLLSLLALPPESVHVEVVP